MKIKHFILIKFIFIFIFLINSNEAKTEDCDTTVSSSLTSQLECTDDDTLNITINGSVIKTGADTIHAKSHSDVTIDNKGTISASTNQAINMQHAVNSTVTNSGTIEATLRNAILMDGTSADNITINNSGSLKAGKKQVILATNSENTTIINSGSIETTNSSNPNTGGINYYNTSGSAINGATITNSGTIFAYGTGIRFGTLGIASKAVNNMTITNSGTIEGETASIVVHNANATGTNIITKEEGTYIGEISLNDTATTFTLDCSISKDQDIELGDKTNISITNNLCGNDTYQILDANKNLDSDNSEADGYLRIYGEELDVVSNNKKYRTEIFSNTLNNIFKSLSDIKERSTFYTQSKRNNIYENSIKGVSGYFLKNEYEEEKTRAFLAYFEQNSNFNSKEKSKSENLAFGYDLSTNINNLSIKPLIGISSNKITDIETESEQIIRNNFIGQFLALNSSYKLKRKIQNNNDLTLTINGEYGAHRLPKYISNFTHGDLSVDEAIDQVLGAGFDVEYSIKNKNGFILKPYAGLAFNKTLSGKIKINDINGAGLKEDISKDHTMNGAVAKKIGFSLTKNTEDIGISLNFEHSNMDKIINNNLNLSISKKLQRIVKKRKEEEKLDPELENLFDQLQVVRENERLALVANKLNKENQAMKELIIQLIKENQKIKTENKLLIKNMN
ncbi:hypothetical protein N9U97_00515 [Candidatus Pelagibacter sp.]|nr:hypothetical protein [Candidatus Pelagibacter sp.]MDA9754443.1 hypothetical protein [Candidatus Pelagibacter sp.]